MSNMSMQVQHRMSHARFVVSSLETHREVVVQGLMAYNATLPAAVQLGEDAIRAFLAWLGAAIEDKTEAMVEAEMAYVAEQADDPEVRARRDASVPGVVEKLLQTRARVGQVLGDEGLATYGLRRRLPRLPAEIADYAEVVIELLRTHPRAVDDGLGTTLDTTVIAGALETAWTPLRQALDDLQTEQRELEGAMIRRDQQVDEWHETYQGGATAATGLYRMARQLALSQRVRPTRRRGAGADPAPIDDTPAPPPAPDSPVPGEDDAVETSASPNERTR